MFIRFNKSFERQNDRIQDYKCHLRSGAYSLTMLYNAHAGCNVIAFMNRIDSNYKFFKIIISRKKILSYANAHPKWPGDGM